jgi:hypothetical protein
MCLMCLCDAVFGWLRAYVMHMYRHTVLQPLGQLASITTQCWVRAVLVEGSNMLKWRRVRAKATQACR